MDPGDHPIVFFDGFCGLCNRSVDLILRKDTSHLYRFAPLQGETAGKQFSGRSDDELLRTFWLKDEEGLHSKSTAWLRIAPKLGGLYKLTGILWIVPRPVRDWVYGLVAKHRYGVFGKREACRIPTAEERPYFLP